MGSTGSGMFGAYRNGGAGSIESGRKLGEAECPLEIENVRLEDVAISDYYLHNKNVPDVNESVELSMQLVNKRLALILSGTGVVIGNLPVKYNFLNLCMKKGKRYLGVIKASGLSPVPYIVVNLYA